MLRDDLCVERFFGNESRPSLQDFQFFAKHDLITVTIKPTKYNELPKLELLNGAYGPFQPFSRYNVPLWLACYLQTRDLCDICYPQWLSVRELGKMIEREKETDQAEELPCTNFFEIAMVLLFSAKQESDPHNDLEELRRLVQKLKFIRSKKIKSLMYELKERSREDVIEFKNVTKLETKFIQSVISTIFEPTDEIIEGIDAQFPI